MTLSTLKSLITAERHHLIEPGALLEDLLGCHMAQGLAINLETALGLPEFPERIVAGWRTVGDVIASVAEMKDPTSVHGCDARGRSGAMPVDMSKSGSAQAIPFMGVTHG